jgi:glycosyltransferase involved in cell wall biosynthesis
MIRIGFVIDSLATKHAGTEQQLLKILSGLDRSVFEPHLFPLRTTALLDDFDLCPVHVIGFSSFKSPRSWVNLIKWSRWLKDHNVDVLQSHFSDASRVAGIAGYMAGVPFMVAARRGRVLWKSGVGYWSLRMVNPAYDVFLANSHFAAGLAEELERVPSTKTQVIPNILNLSDFNTSAPRDREVVRQELELYDGDFATAIVANLTTVKRHDVFLGAARIVTDAIPEVRFFAIGEGPQRAALLAQIQKLGLTDNVHLLGRRADVARMLQAMDVGVLCSEFESASNTLIEYVAAGLPVVCSDVGGNAEIIEDGVNGYLFPNGDASQLAAALIKIRDKAIDGRCLNDAADVVFNKHRSENVISSYETLYVEGVRK